MRHAKLSYLSYHCLLSYYYVILLTNVDMAYERDCEGDDSVDDTDDGNQYDLVSF